MVVQLRGLLVGSRMAKISLEGEGFEFDYEREDECRLRRIAC